MIRNFKYLINIPDDYIDILFNSIEALPPEKSHLILWNIDSDQSLKAREQRSLRGERHEIMREMIRSASFFESASRGKEKLVIQRFEFMLLDEFRYRLGKGKSFSDEQLEYVFGEASKRLPQFYDYIACISHDTHSNYAVREAMNEKEDFSFESMSSLTVNTIFDVYDHAPFRDEFAESDQRIAELRRGNISPPSKTRLMGFLSYYGDEAYWEKQALGTLPQPEDYEFELSGLPLQISN